MPTARAHRCPTATRDGGREHGFGLVEVIVALVIVAILIGGAILTLGGTRNSARAKETLAAGAAYDQAIAAYLTDNANQLPPASSMLVLAGRQAGPRNLLGKPYLGSVPDSVAAGRVGVSMNGSNCGATAAPPTGPGAATASGWVSYCPGAQAPDYAIRVLTRESSGSSWTDVCWRGRTAQQPRCS